MRAIRSCLSMLLVLYCTITQIILYRSDSILTPIGAFEVSRKRYFLPSTHSRHQRQQQRRTFWHQGYSPHHTIIKITTATTIQMATGSTSLLDTMSKRLSEVFDRPIQLANVPNGYQSGQICKMIVQDELATTWTSKEKMKKQNQPQQKYFFVKTAYGEYETLHAEFQGLLEIQKTKSIRVPQPYVCDVYNQHQAFLIMEYLELLEEEEELSPEGNTALVDNGDDWSSSRRRKSPQYELGVQLAKMHQRSSSSGNGHSHSKKKMDTTDVHESSSLPYFGFHVNNTIGSTFQQNLPYKHDWSTFWIEHRMKPMLKLVQSNIGWQHYYENEFFLNDDTQQELFTAIRRILEQQNQHQPVLPCLVHGDLWQGNQGYLLWDATENQRIDDDGDKDISTSKHLVVPAIFDPAPYYGDREVDIAMTYLFGGFTQDFYDGYESVWPLLSSSGRRQDSNNEEELLARRRDVYNLYHMLHHDVIFGGMYTDQVKDLIQRIMF